MTIAQGVWEGIYFGVRFSGRAIGGRACDVVAHRRWPLTGADFAWEQCFSIGSGASWRSRSPLSETVEKSISERIIHGGPA